MFEATAYCQKPIDQATLEIIGNGHSASGHERRDDENNEARRDLHGGAAWNGLKNGVKLNG